MQRIVLARAAALLGGPAVALSLTTGAASAQVATPTGWRTVATISNQPTNGTALVSVAAGNPSHAWAVGITAPNSGTGITAPVVEAWDGSTWSPVTLPAGVLSTLGTNVLLDTASAGGPKDVWAFDLSGHWLRFDGATWTAGKFPGSVLPESSLTIGTSAVWAFGTAAGRTGLAPYAAYHTSTGWKRTPVPGHGGIVDASAVTRRDLWAVIGAGGLFSGIGATRSGSLLHWYAGHWHAVATLPSKLRTASLSSVLARGDKNVWVGGALKNSKRGTTEAVGHWNGHHWTVTTLRAAASVAKWRLIKMVTDGSGGIWALGICGSHCGASGPVTRLWHEVAGTWSRPVEPKLATSRTALLGLAPTGKSVWAVGDEQAGTSANGLIAVWGPTP